MSDDLIRYIIWIVVLIILLGGIYLLLNRFGIL